MGCIACVFSIGFTYCHMLNLQLTWPARIVRGVITTLFFLSVALKGMSLKDLLVTAGLPGLEFSLWHSGDSKFPA